MARILDFENFFLSKQLYLPINLDTECSIVYLKELINFRAQGFAIYI